MAEDVASLKIGAIIRLTKHKVLGEGLCCVADMQPRHEDITCETL